LRPNPLYLNLALTNPVVTKPTNSLRPNPLYLNLALTNPVVTKPRPNQIV
jgi:hypothetical protein